MRQKATPRSRLSSNKLLASLPAGDFRRLLPVLEPIAVSFREVLLTPDQALQRIYFPGGGAYAITQTMKNGETIEVATVGNEGFLGVTALLDGDRWLAGAVVKAPDTTAVTMSLSAFQAEMDRRGAFARLMYWYAQRFLAGLVRSVACNALHSVEERCARWLLTTGDRVGRNEFPLTQEFLSCMLGVRRPSVTLAMSELQRAGAIKYEHRRIVILNRAVLTKSSCECYATIRKCLSR
jgi:CRP-like cAMP-binding protein